MDDTLIYDQDLPTHYERVREYLRKCRENRITLNRDKFEFAQSELKFVGYIVGTEGIKADPDKLDAIAKFPRPENITELRSFMGLANQLGSFCEDLSEVL